MTISYRHLTSADDMKQAEDLQRYEWQSNTVSQHMLFSMMKAGCPIIGAFDGNLLVGVSIAFFGLYAPQTDRPALTNLKLASKRLLVHPDYRSAGIGHQLKLEQKAFADKQGIRMITWTFDPLISRNAYVHIHKLGGIVRQFVPNFYDAIPGQVDAQGYSDRMICQWWITSNRVDERLHGTRPPLSFEQYQTGNAPLVNPTGVNTKGFPVPYEGSFTLGEHSLLLVEIPHDWHACQQEDEGLGHSWRQHSREIFGEIFQYGYIATDVLHETHEGRLRSFYVFGFDG